MVISAQSARSSAALKNLPPYPPVAGKVINLLAGDSVSFQEVADTLKTDAALSAEVLRLANSALTGARYSVSTTLQALNLLGAGQVMGLVMTLSLSRFLKRAGSTNSIRRSWHHNLACALAAKQFAASFGRNSEEAYNAGLFHDIGRLAFLALEPTLYDQSMAAGGDALELERAHFGMDHCEAGAWVMKEWKLPETFVEVALYHLAPKPDGSDLTMLVNASCVIAHRLGYSVILGDPGELEGHANDELARSITQTIHLLEHEYGI